MGTRQRIVTLSPRLLEGLSHQRSLSPFRFDDGCLPVDLKVVRAWYEEESETFVVVVQSESFPEVKLGQSLPRHVIYCDLG